MGYSLLSILFALIEIIVEYEDFIGTPVNAAISDIDPTKGGWLILAVTTNP